MAAGLVLATDPDVIERSADPAAFVVAACGRARAWLWEALEHREIAEARSQAEAVRVYTMRKQLARDVQPTAAEIVRCAERGIGVAIRRGQPAGEISCRGGRGGGNGADSTIFRLGPTDYASITKLRGNGTGERFTDITAQTGRSMSEVRHAVLAWAEREAAAPPEPGPRPQQDCGACGGRVGEPPRPPGRAEDHAGEWLRFAGVAVGLVAVAAAAVSYQAQWRLVYAAKHQASVSYLQAAIPDLGSLVFACFGIALALHGKRAIRARLLNLLCVGISITMNALAARPGWIGLAVWVMSPVIYALASDTLIGVIRAYVIARHRRLHETLAEDEVTPLQIAGAVVLWLVRLAWAPPSTIRGFHRWVKSLPAAPPVRQHAPPMPEPAAEGQRPAVTGTAPTALPGPDQERRADAAGRRPRGGTKQEQFLTLVIARYGPLTGFDLKAVARAAAELAPEAELHPGTARKVLRARVLAAQNGAPR